ncbi:MAG TPA: symmetrical bis(5'-nucleosyl)-tetraphosphatase [Burkholderiales bacterium]|nr:symmetrical bis(5'-nucleosyl)-tetraphosphatase [Burkholderiales bacterium]
MATYAIGDVQGCFDELRQLLNAFQYKEDRDVLWFVGDLVNRGPKSLEVLRFVRSLGEGAIAVLGNHDLHLITQYEGIERPRKDDTFDDVLQAKDAADLVAWLRTRPMMHVERDIAMVHAGLLPQWTITMAARLAGEVQTALASQDYRQFLANMYGSTPERWSESLTGWDRLRVIVNAMTRMRFCSPEGRMEFRAKGKQAPRGYLPWFETRKKDEQTIVFGHWSALGLKLMDGFAALDCGCVWGGSLAALRLEDRKLYQVPCRSYQAAGAEG